MKKIIPLILTLALVVTGIFTFSMVASADYDTYGEYNLLDAKTATFEGGTGDWIQDAGLGTITISSEEGKGIDGSAAMLITPRTNGWDSPKLDILPILLENGPGMYELSAYVAAADGNEEGTIRLLCRDNDNSHGYDASANTPIVEEEFTLVEIIFEVLEVDKTAGTVTLNVATPADMTDPAEKTVSKSFNACFDTGAGPILVDNVCLVNTDTVPTPEPTPTPTPSPEPTPSPVPTPTPILTATPAVTATPAATEEATTKDGNSALVIILIAAAVILLGGGAAAFLIKPKKDGDASADGDKKE